MKSRISHGPLHSDAIDHTKRSLLKALPAFALAPTVFAQGSNSPIQVRKLHSFGLRVSDVDRSLKFYQDIFGCSIQSRQGDTVCLQIGDGPRFFSLSPMRSGEQPGFSHVGLSVEDFDLNAVSDQLAAFGIEPTNRAGPRQASLDVALRSWVSTRGEDRGGASSGTQELFFADIEGLIYQLSPEDHCGGSGATGSLCQAVEPAPDSGLFRTIDLNHFTNFLANNGRANQFYTRIFGKSYQAYQGPTSPIVGVGDGKQFLMYVGGSQEGAPTNPGRVDHVSLSITDFDVADILAKLTGYGLSARADGETDPLQHWVSMRMPNRGGIEGGTPEVYFSDPDGIRIQVKDDSYCGGGGYLGDDCSAPV